jgi:hypothetical protein
MPPSTFEDQLRAGISMTILNRVDTEVLDIFVNSVLDKIHHQVPVDLAIHISLSIFNLEDDFINTQRILIDSIPPDHDACRLKDKIVSDYLAKIVYGTVLVDNGPDCPICLLHIELENFTVLVCGHYQCKNCVTQLTRCATCRD